MKPRAEHVAERDIEAYLVAQVEARKGIAYKFTSPSRRNVPDRLVVLPGRPISFVELKATGKQPTKGQQREHIRIWEAGGRVLVIDSMQGVDRFLEST